MTINILRIELTQPLRIKMKCDTCGGETYGTVGCGPVAVETLPWGQIATPTGLTLEALIDECHRQAAMHTGCSRVSPINMKGTIFSDGSDPAA